MQAWWSPPLSRPTCSTRRRGSSRPPPTLPGVELALITCEPADRVPAKLRGSLAAHWRIDDPLDAGQIAGAVAGLSEQLGPVQRLLGGARAAAGAARPGPRAPGHPGHGRGDRAQLPRQGADEDGAARGRGAVRAAPAGRLRGGRGRRSPPRSASRWWSSRPAGAGAKSTFRLDDADDLRVWLDAAPPAPDRPALIEEFLTGEEGSYDSVMVDGQVVWDSISSYLPTPLEVLRNPWIQWIGADAPRHRRPEYDGIRAVAPTALRALGLRTGLTHMEWFRRPDGTVAVSEVAVRPPGGQITSMLVLRARLRPVPRVGAAHGARQLRAAGAQLVRRDGVHCAARARATSGRCTAWTSCRPR